MIGAVCGDILGSPYELTNEKFNDPYQIPLFRADDKFTDDTVLTLAVADWLLHDHVEEMSPDEAKHKLAARFLEYVRGHYREYHLGYGYQFWHWIARFELVGDDRPYNSSGNGSAMRTSPIAWYFDSIEKVRFFAKLQADVTHNHLEGEKGAQAIACGIFLARIGKGKKDIKMYVEEEFGYDLSQSVESLREKAVFDPTCQGSVPHALTAFLESEDYESSVRLAISYGGDSDTIACMAGSIAEAYYGGVPKNILDHCLPFLNERALQICEEMQLYINRNK